MSLTSQFLLRLLLMVAVVAASFVPVFWLFRWNHENQNSAIISALIAGLFVGAALAAYRLIVHPVATRIDAQRKNRSTSSDG